MLDKKITSKKEIKSAKEAAVIAHKMVLDKEREHFIVINLDAKNRAKSTHIVSIGTLNASLVHPREVFTKAIKTGGIAGFIIAHNHPSGGLEPSEADILLTQRLKDAGQLMGIHLLDSLIMDKHGDYKSII